MGVFGHNDLFSRKYITAIVRDSHNRGYFVHIKKTLDDYFIAKLNNTFYAFSMEGARIITHRYFAVRSFQWIDYDTSHYKSIQMDRLEELKLFLIKNRLPRMNMMQYYMIKLLGRKERKKELKETRDAQKRLETRMAVADIDEDTPDTEIKDKLHHKEIDVPPHDIERLISDIEEKQDVFPTESQNLINYIKSLDIDHVVTPVQKIADYIEDDLIATKPSFIGELMPRLQRILGKHSEITNSPYSTKNAWLTKLFIFGFIIVGAASIIWMVDQGFFDFIGDMIPDFGSAGIGLSALNPANSIPSGAANQCTDEALQQRYAEPIDLKIAVDSGKEACDIPKKTQELLKNIELPKATPKEGN